MNKKGKTFCWIARLQGMLRCRGWVLFRGTPCWYHTTTNHDITVQLVRLWYSLIQSAVLAWYTRSFKYTSTYKRLLSAAQLPHGARNFILESISSECWPPLNTIYRSLHRQRVKKVCTEKRKVKTQSHHAHQQPNVIFRRGLTTRKNCSAAGWLFHRSRFHAATPPPKKKKPMHCKRKQKSQGSVSKKRQDTHNAV